MRPSFYGFLFLLLTASLSFSPGAMSAETGLQSASAAGAEASVKDAGDIDFAAYQRNIDDMFEIALMTNPNIDYGINSVIIDLNRKIAENPENPSPLISLGHIYRILGRPSEASRFYQKALALDPGNFHLNVFSGVTHFLEEDLDKALARLDKAVEINPADAYTRLARGRVLMLLGKEDEAVKNFQELLSYHPGNRQASFALSLLYQKKGDNAKALEILESLKSENPDDLFLQYHLGAIHMASGKAGEALKYWEKLFQEGVRDVQFLFNLSVAYLKNGDTQKASIIVGHLNFFFPNEQDVEILMAETYKHMRQYEEAERRYRVLLAQNPENLVAAMGLAEVLKLQGKEEEMNALMSGISQRVQAQQKREAAEAEQSSAFRELFQPETPAA